MKNISVLVSGGGTNLQAVIDNVENGFIENAKIVQVIASKEDAYALTRAKITILKAYISAKKIIRSCRSAQMLSSALSMRKRQIW